MAIHTERTFEETIESQLLSRGGWAKGNPSDFDRKLALRSKDLFAFVQDTQPTLWADLRKQHGQGLEDAVLNALVRALDSWGTLEILRHGFKVAGKKMEAA